MYIRKRGKGWQAQVRVNGKYKTKSFTRKAEATDWARQQEHDQFSPNTITLHSLVEKYIAEVSVNHKGEKQEVLRLRRIAKSFPDIPIANLKKDQFSDWKNDLLKTRSPGTVRRYMTAFNGVLNHAVTEWAYLKANPLQGVKKPPEPPHRERYPTDEEAELICRQLGYKDKVETKNQEVAVSLLLALETAMRTSEILSITPETVNLKARYVKLIDTKNGDSREVPLSSRAVELIKQLPGCRFTVMRESHSVLFRKAVKAAGIKGLRFHDSRAGGLMRLSKKVDVLTLARIVGHRDPRSLMIYYREEATNIAKLLD